MRFVSLRVFCSRYHIPVYASLGTLEALDTMGELNGNFPVYQITDTADIGDYHIAAFHTMHDSAESLGFTVERIGVFQVLWREP